MVEARGVTLASFEQFPMGERVGMSQQRTGERSDGQPVQTRRRGRSLQDAIFAATLDELLDRGYERSTMEGIADRARTGKASLYRRWPAKSQLVLDALVSALPGVHDPVPEFGSLREDLMYLLVRMNKGLEEPAGRILRSIIVQGRPPELVGILDEHVIQPRIDQIVAAMRRAADRGEIGVSSPVLLASQVGPAMIMHHRLLRGTPPSTEDIGEIVDRVILPALCGDRSGLRS